MLRDTRLWQRIRCLRQRIQPQTQPNPLAEWPGPGKSPYSERDIVRHGEVITWETYLSQQTRMSLLDLHSLECLDNWVAAFWDWEPTQCLLERLRISHFEEVYLDYTVPDSCAFCVWLPREEIRTRVFTSPVPPFEGLEYVGTMRAAVPHWTTDSSEIRGLMRDEELTLLASQRIWQPKHYAIVQYYLTLTYNSAEQQRHGRWVQTHY